MPPSLLLRPGKKSLLALHVVAGPAGQAQPAGRLRVQDHRVADGHVRDALADLVHPAGVLVADHVGKVGVHRLGPVAVDDVQVGAADAGAADLDDDVEGPLERRLRYVVDLGVLWYACTRTAFTGDLLVDSAVNRSDAT